MKPIANILWWPGTNCHHETMYAFELVGAKPHLSLINRLISGKENLYECDILFFPGGFSRGDHIRAAAIPAIEMQYRLGDQLQRVIERGIPIGGSCNGFQIMACLGLFNNEIGNPKVLLDMNKSATFEHWWKIAVYLHHHPGCPWTDGLDGMRIVMPSAHGEGLVVGAPGEQIWKVAATYGSPEGVTDYPKSPNGGKVAGICYRNYFAAMPHFERALFDQGGKPHGLLVFEAAVRSVR